jgi:cytochrome b
MGKAEPGILPAVAVGVWRRIRIRATTAHTRIGICNAHGSNAQLAFGTDGGNTATLVGWTREIAAVTEAIKHTTHTRVRQGWECTRKTDRVGC